MATQWVETDFDGLSRLAILWDEYNKKPTVPVLAEIRLQEQRFGLSPLDRSRLQWEIRRADAAERKGTPEAPKTPTKDPRKLLQMTLK
jgi:hypothetical protein